MAPRDWTLGQDKPEDPIPSYETEGTNKVFYHATSPENVPTIMESGLMPPVYMMNGRFVVQGMEKLVREKYARYGTYPGGEQVLLRITLPRDWPLRLDEASYSGLFAKSMRRIPPDHITIDNKHWP